MIIKSNGERVPFEEKRLFTSLVRAGADKEVAKIIVEKIKQTLFEGITTRKIYSSAFKILRRMDSPAASRYQIKWAMMRLGSRQGFSFEQYMAKLFEKMGYKVKLNMIAKGKNITHEVDLVLENNGKKIMVECKHRSRPGMIISIKTPLYVYARFLDLKERFSSSMLVTNARFSKQSVQYSEGVNLKLMGWDKGIRSLQKLIDYYKVYPVTTLRTVDNSTLKRLLEKRIIVVSDILERKSSLPNLLGRDKAARVVEEAGKLVGR